MGTAQKSEKVSRGNRTFFCGVCMVVTWWILAFWNSALCKKSHCPPGNHDANHLYKCSIFCPITISADDPDTLIIEYLAL